MSWHWRTRMSPRCSAPAATFYTTNFARNWMSLRTPRVWKRCRRARYASAKAGPHLCSTASPSTAGDDSGLKDELEPELDLPGPVRAAGADSALYDLPERRAVQIVRELAAVGAAAAGHPVAIEHVEGLGAELEALALGDS